MHRQVETQTNSQTDYSLQLCFLYCDLCNWTQWVENSIFSCDASYLYLRYGSIDVENKRQTDRQTDRQIKQKQAGRQTDRQAERQTDRQTDRQTHRQTDRQTDRPRDRQKDRQTERRTNRQMHRQPDVIIREMGHICKNIERISTHLKMAQTVHL